MEVLLLQDSPCLCTNNYAHVHKHIHSCNRPTYASIFQEHVFNIFIQCGEDYPPMYTQGQEEKGEFKENRKETTVERKKKWRETFIYVLRDTGATLITSIILTLYLDTLLLQTVACL